MWNLQCFPAIGMLPEAMSRLGPMLKLLLRETFVRPQITPTTSTVITFSSSSLLIIFVHSSCHCGRALVDFWIENKYTLRYSGGLVPDVYHILAKGQVTNCLHIMCYEFRYSIADFLFPTGCFVECEQLNSKGEASLTL